MPPFTRWLAVATTAAAVALAVPAGAPASAAVAPEAVAALRAAWSPIPSYAVAAHDEPVTYRNGCHAARLTVVPKACTFAKKTATRTVMLFGDSHANHWYGAVLAAASQHGWRMLFLTKSSCPAADVAVLRYTQSPPYPQCSTWRSRALPMIAAQKWGHVDVAVISNWHFHSVLSRPGGRLVTGSQKAVVWEAGMRRTLAAVLKGAGRVVLLRDSPDLPGDAASARACYARWRQAAQTKCGTRISRALNSAIWAAERRAAAAFPGKVATVDLSTPFCRRGWCGPLDGRYLAFKDDNHWTQTYMRVHFAPLINRELVAAMALATA
jgi:hypothetical protein